jgi:type IX secretion system PorP/SprF family membrane protein
MSLRCLFMIIFCVLFFSVSRAQQDVLYSQYFFNQLAINPAYAGNDDVLNITGLSRKQWFGLNGSPTTFSVFGHTPLLTNHGVDRTYSDGKRHFFSPNNQIGLGMVLCSAHVGVSNNFLASFAYSYKILLSDEERLSFGLQGSVFNFHQLYNQLDNINTFDPVFQNNISVTKFNVGAGVFYETARYYAGLSVPEIIENHLNPENASGEKQLRQYFITGGYLFYLNLNIKIKPTFLLRYTDGLPPGFDISANVLYKDKTWIGISYRYNNAVSLIGEFLATSKFRIGLAYDYPISRLHLVTHGSAELMLSYTFQKSTKRIINPRYF